MTTTEPGEVVEIPVAQTYPGPKIRTERLDLDHVAALAEVDGDKLPPVDARRTEKGYEILDGAHRIGAAKRREDDKIRAVLLDLDDAEALERAYLANQGHGLPLTLTEKRAGARRFIAETALSDGSIAKLVGLHRDTVANLRPAVQPAENRQVGRSQGSDGKQRPASKADVKAQREAIATMLAENSDLSLHEVARRVGCSAMTVASVRDEVRRKAEESGKGSAPQPDHVTDPDLPPSDEPHVTDQAEGDEADASSRPPLGLVAPPSDDAPSVGDLVMSYPAPGDWKKHPSFKRTNAGRDLATVIDRRSLTEREPFSDLAAGCPGDMRAALAAHAQHQAGLWLDLADRLSTPTTLTEAR